MAKLKTLKPRVELAPARKLGSVAVSERRITGRRLQERRHRLWLESPVCAECGRVVPYPAGFELDHIVPLYLGGADEDENCQILCSGPDGCHAKKTAEDLRGW